MTDVRDRRDLPILGVDEALQRVLESVPVLGPEEIPLEACRGRTLAEEIRSTADMPPFDRTAMDGFALRARDVASPPAVLEVIEEIPAGRDPARSVGSGQASRIMTGAMIPPGADAIVMVEDTESVDDGRRVRILRAPKPGAHIRRAGEDLAAGALLMSPGTPLGAAGIGLLAAEGRATARVAGRPSVALLSTGDELVTLDAAPRGSQIRETNSWSLRALLGSMGIAPALLGIARDERSDIAGKLGLGLGSDVLLVSGGVSMGEYDLVGAGLREAG